MSSSLRFDLERHTLRNGLRVVLHRDTRLPLVTVNLWYHVGSKNERAGRTGFAHLFEHLLFQGSENIGTNDHFRFVQQVGGVANGSTWYDRTNYFETLPSHHLDRGLWLESDRMGFFLGGIHQEKLDNQRDVVMNERRQRVDNQPYGRATEMLYEMHFPEGHPYRWPVIGYMEDIAAAELDMVKEFFGTYYVPNNAVLTVAGDIDYGQALERVERFFGDIPAGPAVTPPRVPSVEPRGLRRATLEDQVKLPRVYLAFASPKYGEKDWYAADLLTTLLSTGKASLLYRDLVVDRRLAQDVNAYVLPTEEPSSINFVISGGPDVGVDALEDAMVSHVEALSETLLDSSDVERARNGLLRYHYAELQSLADRADLMSQFTTYFDAPEAAAGEIERYREITAEDLREVAARYLRTDHRSVVAVPPAS